MMRFFNQIKFIGWKRLLVISGLTVFGLFSTAAVAHIRQNGLIPKNEVAQFNSPTPISTIDCPDRIVHDAQAAPLWIKGSVEKRISGEEESLITTNCASPSPSPTIVQATTPSPKVAKKSTPKTSLTVKIEPSVTSSPINTSPLSIANPTPSPSVTLSLSPSPVASPTLSSTPSPTPKVKGSPPVLKNLGITFAAYDSISGRAGSFDFLKLQRKPFVDFGDNGSEPTFTYLTAEDAEVTAVADGYVYKIEYQAQYSDYSIVASTEKNILDWSIDYDHIINPTVAIGDKITAGQKLGIVGSHSDIGIGRVEIQVFGGDGSSASYCPFVYFDSSTVDSYKAKLQKLMDDYEAYMFNTNIYNPNDYTSSGHVGCKIKSL